MTTPSAKADGFFRICTDDDMALASCFSKFSFWTIAIDSSKGCYPLWAAYFETQLAAIKRFYTRNGLENRETSYRYQRTVFTLLSWNSKVKCYFTAYIRPLKEAVLRRYFIIWYWFKVTTPPLRKGSPNRKERWNDWFTIYDCKRERKSFKAVD